MTRAIGRGYRRRVRIVLLAVAATLILAAPAEAVPQWLAPVDVETGRVTIGEASQGR